jgi:23S rRNA (guanosine2251-2'-O)-methyltransferase
MHRKSKHADLFTSVSEKSENDLFDILKKLDHPPFILILDCVQDPHNLGACLRSADAAGVDAVIAPKDRAVGLTDTVRRIASGGAENVPFIRVTNLARIMEILKEEAKFWIVGTADKAEQTIHEIDLTGPIAIVMGAEGQGLRRLTAQKCDFLAKIPMAGSVDCLNVSVATGVCLFEAVRQRTRSS